MLASITPLGERGRRSHWPVTIAAFALAAAAAGAAAGAVTGALGGVLLAALSTHARLAALTVALGVAIVVELKPGAVPGPSRQVDERWLDSFRGWVYGAGYGAQLGLGLTTVVTSSCTYVATFCAFLSATPARGAVITGCYGALRGLQPLATVGVRRPSELIRFHARLERWRGRAARGGTGAMAVLLVLAAGSLA